MRSCIESGNFLLLQESQLLPAVFVNYQVGLGTSWVGKHSIIVFKLSNVTI